MKGHFDNTGKQKNEWDEIKQPSPLNKFLVTALALSSNNSKINVWFLVPGFSEMWDLKVSNIVQIYTTVRKWTPLTRNFVTENKLSNVEVIRSAKITIHKEVLYLHRNSDSE